MTKSRIALLGSALLSAALLCGAGAKAQDYNYSGPYDRAAYSDRAYDDRTETVIVHPYYDEVQKRQLTGHINGEVNPTEFSLSRPVGFSDLDLSRRADRLELRDRIHEAALDMCAQLDEQVPQLRGDSSADRECVRTATRNAMRDVFG